MLQKSTPFGRGGLPKNRDVLHFVIFAEIRKSTPNLHHFCRNRRKSRKIAHFLIFSLDILIDRKVFLFAHCSL